MRDTQLAKVGMILMMALAVPVVGASDLAREQRLKDQIIDAILDGEPTMLTADGLGNYHCSTSLDIHATFMALKPLRRQRENATTFSTFVTTGQLNCGQSRRATACGSVA